MALMKGVSNSVNVDALAGIFIVPEILVLLVDCELAALNLYICSRCYKLSTINT